jgi:Zn-dependent peptidase ImmA (M78 family)/transcriptional regulator with XRE-family HTH domain
VRHAEDINPAVLRWARETAGLTVDQAASKLGLKDSGKQTAAEKLDAVEGGARPVSEGFLKKAAAIYSRPLLTFYLPAPPPIGDRGVDFRPFADRSSGPRGEAMLDALAREVRARQQMLREVLGDLDEAQPLKFVASTKLDANPERVADRIRQTLGLTIADQRDARSPDGLFKILRNACGSVGIYALLLGDLGSHHSDIGADLFRGMAVADDIAPVVVVNDNDVPVARSFTLIHELAHVWLGATGVSGPLAAVPTDDVERFCNAVASNFLLPAEGMADFNQDAGSDVDATLAEAARIAGTWNVSHAAVVYRATTMQLVGPGTAREAFAILASRWRSHRAQSRADRDPDEGGPSYYVTRRFSLGGALLDVVRRALQADTVTHTKAARLLGVAPASVDTLLRDRARAA